MPQSRKPNISSMEAHHTSNPWTYLEVKRSTVKVTGTINPVTESVSYLPNGKAYERQTVHRWSTKTCIADKRHDRQGQGRKVTWCVWQVLGCWPISREPNVIQTPILVRRLPTPGQLQGQKSKVKGQGHHAGRLMLRPKVRHIFCRETTVLAIAHVGLC